MLVELIKKNQELGEPPPKPPVGGRLRPKAFFGGVPPPLQG